MSQHDMTIDNQARTLFRQDIQNALQALVTLNSGATEPVVKFSYMLWPDTATGLLKIRNSANNAWITLGLLAGFKLDDWAAPDDNTDLDVSITKHGLCPKAPNDAGKVLRGAGLWDFGGKLIQVIDYQTGEYATGSTLIPHDDTIPQKTEGNEFMSVSITPKNASNILIIQVCGCWTCDIANWVIAALFQDDITNALAANFTYMPFANTGNIITFIHKMLAGTISSTTFKVRVGPNSTSSLQFNGVGGGRKLGGVITSSITIWEIAA